MGNSRVRIAVIGCEPKNFHIRFTCGSKRYDIRHLMRKRIEAHGEKYRPVVHWPVNDIKDFPDTKKVDAVVIPGSPLNADDETLKEMEWMRKLLDFIAHVHEKVPLLGVCFGHQAIAKTFGSEVAQYSKRNIFYEVGFEPTTLTDDGMLDPLFKGFSKRFPAMYSHFQYVKTAPEGGLMLAKSSNHKNKSMQAYRIGDRTYGVQFHPDYNTDNITEIVRARNETIMKNIGMRPINYSVDERQDHKIIRNFLQLI